MSMTLNLEIADGINSEQVAQALSSISGAEITNNGSLLEAYFPHSNASVSAKSDLIDAAILTEELENAGWKVGMRIYFDIDPTLPNSLRASSLIFKSG